MTARDLRRAASVLVCGACCAPFALAACLYDVPDVGAPAPDVDSGVSGPDVSSTDGSAAKDAGGNDANVADAGGCNPDAAFGTPALVSELADPSYDARYPRLTSDERTIYYAFGPAAGPFVLYSATRATTSSPFSGMAPIAGLTGANGSDNNVTVSEDGLVALLSSNRKQGSVNPTVSQIWSTSRANTSAAFSTPLWSNTGFGSQDGDYDPFFVSGGGGLFYLASVSLSAPGIAHIRRATFVNGTYGSASGPDFSTGNSAADDRAPVLTPDELRIYYATNANPSGGVLGGGAGNVWTSSRPSTALQWRPPTVVAELSGFGTYPKPGWVSADDCRLYLFSNKSGHDAIYVATRGH